MSYDKASNSSRPQPKKTLDELSLNISQNKKTLVELDPSTSSRTPFIAKDPKIGKTIGDNNRYLLQSLLGQGGMGKVYRALDNKFENRVVAIKLMTNYAGQQQKHLIKRFIRETKAISVLKHPNIVEIFDCGVTPDEAPFCGSPFYVMEYFEGKTLQSLLKQHKTLHLSYLLKIIRQVCAGLKEVHKKDMVHRDLKPDNIFLVTGDTFADVVKIIDFGIAKNLISDDTKLTKVGSFLGTYRYASPEQCRGLPNIDQRSDIYSLGIILYEAICGQNPYDLDEDFRSSQADWIACHIKVPPKPLKEQPGCENLPDELANIVMQCLAKFPQDRFSDIGALPDALANSVSVRMGLNYDSDIDKKASNKLEKNIHQSQRKSEVKLATPKTIIETTNNNTPPNVTSSSSRKKLNLGLLMGVVAILIGMVGTVGYLGAYLLLKRPQNISQNDLKSRLELDNNNPETTNANNISLLVKTLEAQYQQSNYQNCYQLATENPNQDNFVIKGWIGKCGLAAAKTQAELDNFSGAIAIAQKIPNTVPNYQEVQDNINTWSGKILDYATKIYQEGNLEQAVKMTETIPESSNLKATVSPLISQWQQEEENHKTLIDNAQNLLNRGQWYAAKLEVEKIPTEFVFWRQEAQPILDRANQKINALAAAQRRRRAREQQRRAQEEQRRRAQEEQRRRAQEQEQLRRAQTKETTPLPSLREKLKNTPLLDDDTLRERLQREPNP
ncbi:MAG: serine/threonine-protein kinase [Xenococcaceae cyanobacterium MO_207.B15]|nr:serine/threonine-protein kinase [Xenococcaceae cyanobacterium MO_207.B15]